MPLQSRRLSHTSSALSFARCVPTVAFLFWRTPESEGRYCYAEGACAPRAHAPRAHAERAYAERAYAREVKMEPRTRRRPPRREDQDGLTQRIVYEGGHLLLPTRNIGFGPAGRRREPCMKMSVCGLLLYMSWDHGDLSCR
jgi:hypothetical protein